MLNQLVSIGCYASEFSLVKIEVYTIHHWAQLIVCGSKYGLVDTVHQNINIERHLGLLCRQLVSLWITYRVCTRHRRVTSAPSDINLPVALVYAECKRHLRALLQYIEHQLCWCCNCTLTLHAIHLNRAYERSFEIRSCNLQNITLQLHQEVVEDWKSVFAVNYFTCCCQ